MIADMVASIFKTMPVDADTVSVCMGLSGLGFSGCKEELKKAALVDLCNNVQIALDSVSDDGCIVIVGMGNVGYLRKNGEHILVGGCGYRIDSSLYGALKRVKNLRNKQMERFSPFLFFAIFEERK